MKLNLISARADCLSLPTSFSISIIICSNICFSLVFNFNAFKIRWSPSTNLVAANLSGIWAFLAWSSVKCIMAWIHLCIAACSGEILSSQKSNLPGHSLNLATWIACSISSSIPIFFDAEIGITGIPRVCSNKFTLIVPPFSWTSSIILSASTIGISISINCIVK